MVVVVKVITKRNLSVLLLLFLATQGFAQRKNFVNRTIDWSYKIVQGDSAHPRKKYFFPVPILSYKPETRWIFGLSLTHLFRAKNGDSITRPSTIRLNVSYSQNNQFSIRPFVDIFTKQNRFNIKALYQYTNFSEYFWGTGIDAPKADKELYHFDMHKFNIKGAYQFVPKLYAGIQVNLEKMYNVRYDNNPSAMQNSGIAGTQGSFSSGAGFTVYYDDRNNIYFPTKGHYIELSNCIYNEALGSNYNFSNLTFDGRKYIGLWKQNVVAVQAIANMNWGNVPFRLMGTLGSDSYMRGYYNGRYRDNCAMAFQTELRKTIWGPISVVGFGGFGTVSPSPNQLAKNLKPNYGAGLRIMAIPREKMNIRMDYGKGVDGNAAFYITMSEAF
jgi:outer membrane protein assembly factor BamA